jgi:phosphonate transport system permease protein
MTRTLQRAAALAIDVMLGAYLGTVIYCVILPAVVEGPSAPPIAITLWAVIIGAVLGGAASMAGASIGRCALRREWPQGWRKAVIVHALWTLLIATIISGWVITHIDPLQLFSQQGLQGASRIFTALFTPETSIIGQALGAMVETIYLAFMATVFAVPFSFLLSFFSARNLMRDTSSRRAIYVVVRFITNFSRSIEPLIWAIVFSVWVGIGPFAGMLALVVHTVASLTKQYAEQIEDVDYGPMEAIETTGARRTQVIWFSVVPQCVIPFLSFTIYRWDINVRMATVIGLVGGGGIGNMLIQYQGLAQWNEVGMIVIIIATVVWLMDVISARVREALK